MSEIDNINYTLNEEKEKISESIDSELNLIKKKIKNLKSEQNAKIKFYNIAVLLGNIVSISTIFLYAKLKKNGLFYLFLDITLLIVEFFLFHKRNQDQYDYITNLKTIQLNLRKMQDKYKNDKLVITKIKKIDDSIDEIVNPNYSYNEDMSFLEAKMLNDLHIISESNDENTAKDKTKEYCDILKKNENRFKLGKGLSIIFTAMSIAMWVLRQINGLAIGYVIVFEILKCVALAWRFFDNLKIKKKLVMLKEEIKESLQKSKSKEKEKEYNILIGKIDMILNLPKDEM